MPSKKLTLLVASLATLPLAACSTPTIPLTETGLLEALPPIKYHDYCSAQKGIAEHNSRWETIRDKKPVVYKAPCDVEKKVARAQ